MAGRFTIKLNPIRIFLYIIIILNLNVFYLVDKDAIPMSDICILIEAIFGIYVFYKHKGKIKYRYGFLMIMPILFAVISAYTANRNFMGQPYFWGFRPQRAWLVSMLMYFPLAKLFKNGVLNKEELMSIIDNVVVVYVIVIFVQFLIGSRFQFMHVGTNERYGSIRLYVISTFIVMSYFFHLSRILGGEKIKKKDILFIVIAIFVITAVAKSRMRIVSFFGASIIYICSQKLTKRKLAIVAICIAGCCIFLSTDAGRDIMNMAGGAVSTENDTSEIRDAGREFYIEMNTQSWERFVIGSGYPNWDWHPAFVLSGADNNIYSNDNGMFGLFFQYGIIFVIWAVVLSYKNIRLGLKGGVAFLALYSIYGLLGSYTLFPCFYVTDISFASLCAITEQGVDEFSDKDK